MNPLPSHPRCPDRARGLPSTSLALSLAQEATDPVAAAHGLKARQPSQAPARLVDWGLSPVGSMWGVRVALSILSFHSAH